MPKGTAHPLPEPFQKFYKWFTKAKKLIHIDPNAMTLATVGKDGKPAARMVLLKGYDLDGFVFFTNYQSRKGRELMNNPNAALVLWWRELRRQIRIEGKIEKISSQDSERYFQTRPRGSQLGAWASRQSQKIENYEDLKQKFESLEEKYKDRDIPRPPHWGGFLLKPSDIEFWEGQKNRLHHRVKYSIEKDGNWRRYLLSP